MRNPLTAFGCAVVTVAAALVVIGAAWLILSPLLAPVAAEDAGGPCGGVSGVAAILAVLLLALLAVVTVVAAAMLRRFRW